MATDWFLSYMDYVLEWAHYLSMMMVPWRGGGGGKVSCIPAIYLAILVRFVVATVFAAIRVVLGMPVRL